MRKTIKKLIALTIVTTTILGTSSIGANAEWKSNSIGWWNTEGSSWSVGWKQIDSKWYFFDNNGYMKTGWIQDTDAKWYYLNSSGEMATNTVVNGYTIDNNGVWVSSMPNTVVSTTSTNTAKVETTNVIPTTTSSNSSNSSSSSSSSSPSNSITNDYITIHYDEKYKMLDVMGGKQINVETNGIKYDYIIINASDYNMSKSDFIKKVWSIYDLKNDNGTIKLVKKSDANSLSTQTNTTSNIITEPIEVTPLVTSPPAVAIS